MVAVSARMLAQLAVADGYEVTALDRFGDVDLRAIAPGATALEQRRAGSARRPTSRPTRSCTAAAWRIAPTWWPC